MLLTFRPSLNRIEISTYSPLFDAFENDEDSRFSLQVDLTGRLGPFQEITTLSDARDQGTAFPPIVEFTSPGLSTVVPQGQSVSLRSTASDIDGSVTKVEYYHNSKNIEEFTSPPFEAPCPPHRRKAWKKCALPRSESGPGREQLFSIRRSHTLRRCLRLSFSSTPPSPSSKAIPRTRSIFTSL